MYNACSDSPDGVGIYCRLCNEVARSDGMAEITAQRVGDIESRRSVGDKRLLEIYTSILNRDTMLRTIAPGLFVCRGGARKVK